MDLPRLLDARDLRDRLVASDPALERLRTGLRAVAGAAVAAALLSRAGAAAGVPPTVWLLGVSFAMSSSVFVPESDASRERRALGLVTAVAAASAGLAAIAAATPAPAGAAIALAVVFLAVWSRRFAAAGIGAGMAAFLVFFVARYFQLRPAQVPAAAAAIVAGGAIASAVRFGLFPARPGRAGPRTLAALRLTVAIVLRRLEDSVVAGPSPREARRLGRDIDRLHEAALGVDDLLVRFPAPTLPSGLAVETLRERVFELQLAAERVVQAVGQVIDSAALPGAARRQARAALEAARRIAIRARGRRERIGPHLARAARLAREAGAPPRWRDDLRRLRTSLADLARAARWLRGAVPERRLPAPAAPAPIAQAQGPSPHGLRHPTRQALQATIAAALAMAAGARLSSTRWFWAVIAAFVMFTNATTVADTVARAWLRVLGTVLGAAGGILLGAAVAGHPRLQLAAAFTCIFLAYWLFRVSYAWLLFWFTALIAVLYRLLGRYTPELLVLRVEETLLGAGIGVVVAALVLPVRARTRVRALTAEVLRAVAAWLDAAVVARAAGRGGAPLDAARAMEDRLRALRAAARPLIGSRIASPRAAHLVHATTAVVLYARHLAPGEALERLDPAAREEVAEAGRRLTTRARRVAAILAGDPAPEGPDPGGAAEPIAHAAASLQGDAARPRGPATPPVWLAWLARLDEALGDLAAVTSDDGADHAAVDAQRRSVHG